MSVSTPVKPTGSRPQLPPSAGIARAEAHMARWLAAHSVTLLRVSLGLVFLGFGVLKFFPGASPAEDLVMRTVDALTLGVVSGTPAVVMTAAMETFIGLTLVTGRGLRAGLVVLAGAMVGIMSPLVLFPGDLFPGGLPTIEGQYVLKDIVLAAAGAVVAARALGATYVVSDGR
jgi:putative oxidoreductase